MSDPFANPAAPSSGVDLAELKGSLVIINVRSLEEGINTSFGAKDAIRGDLAVVDGPHAGDTHPDALLFPTVLVSQLRPRIGSKVIGRIGTGNAKPGQKPPWRLDEASDADRAAGPAMCRRWSA